MRCSVEFVERVCTETFRVTKAVSVQAAACALSYPCTAARIGVGLSGRGSPVN